MNNDRPQQPTTKPPRVVPVAHAKGFAYRVEWQNVKRGPFATRAAAAAACAALAKELRLEHEVAVKAEARRRSAALASKRSTGASPPPRYDEVYREGMAALDAS